MSADIIPLDATAAVFGASGALSQRFPGYEPRDGQVSMARLVSDVLRDGGGALCDAPCGTGKSVAYLAPSILRAVKRNERVVVATANIALQEQLFTKDLPALKTTLAPLLGDRASTWTFALLKGRSNYICRSLVSEPEQRQEWEASLSTAELSQLAEVDRWASRTETGDRSELPFVVGDSVWRMRAMDREDCHGKACEHYDGCFARKAHDRAAEASVVVVNYHLLFAHIALRMETGRDVLLPEFHALILDEAHEAGDIARDFFGHTLSEGRVKRVVKWCRNVRAQALKAGVVCDEAEGTDLAQAADELARVSSRFFAVLTDTITPLLSRTPRVNTLRSDAPGCADALVALAEMIDPYDTARRLATRLDARIARASKNGDLPDGDARRAALRVQTQARSIARACVKALSWMEDATEERGTEPGTLDCIHWIAAEERSHRGTRSTRITWESRHIDLAPVLRAEVWERTRTVVACSATMTTGEGATGWQWIKRQLGAPPVARVLAVASPFDFARQALLCLPSGTHDPKRDRDGFDAFVLDVVAKASRAAGGRTLGLFTSTRMAKDAAAHLRRLVNTSEDSFSDVTVLAQGDAPRTQLVADFRADETSVLMGTASLWTGVDVPGSACVCVVVDKLPFAPPGDPVLDALCERAVARTGRDLAGFFEESLPRAVLALRQGVGRLIRSTGDWGCVIVCDPRLSTKGYGADIVKALAMPRRTRSVAEACAWLAEGVEGMQRREVAVNE